MGLIDQLKKTSDTTKFSMPAPQTQVNYEDDDDYDDKKFTDLPDIRQNDNYSCGAAVTMSVGKYFGVGPDTLGEWKKLLGTNVKKSTDPRQIVSVLESFGLQVVVKCDMTEDELCYYAEAHVPVICPIQEYGIPSKQTSDEYGHYVAVIGQCCGYVFVQDPSLDNVLQGQGTDAAPGRMMIPCDIWDKIWHDDNLYGKSYDHCGICVHPAPKEY